MSNNTGKKLRKLRLRRGMTTDELADRCDVSRDYIILLERGLTSPSLTMFEKILDALSTTPVEFYTEPVFEPVVFDEPSEDTSPLLVPSEMTMSLSPRIIDIAPGEETELRSGDETYFYVLVGMIQIVCDGETYRASNGASIYVKPYMAYKFIGYMKSATRLLAVSVKR